MKAVGYQSKGPITVAGILQDIELPVPSPVGHDLLVRIGAVSVNPVDAKIRSWMSALEGTHRILGWDAAGIVTAMGPEAQGFQIGDRIFYAGSLERQGTDAEFNLVDARLAAKVPNSIPDTEAAALPLTTITAWEMLFDRLDVQRPVPGAATAVLIIGGAGGVGSMAIQLLRARTDLTVIATASKPESAEWCRSLGAHHVLDHSNPLAAQVAALEIGAPGFVFSTAASEMYRDEVIQLMAPQGRFGFIDDPASFDVMPFKGKSISVHMESMFTRSIFVTADMARQGALLTEVADLIEGGKIRTTLNQVLGTISAATLTEAHALIETGSARGKIVLTGYPG